MKTIKQSNFRVEVYPKTTLYGIRVANEMDVCELILASIKRHVDNLQSAEIVSNVDSVCSFCGSLWTEDGDTYNGGCCAGDQATEDPLNQGDNAP